MSTTTGEERGEWTQATAFTVAPRALEMPAKAFDGFIAAIPQGRPRLKLAGKEIAEFRKQAKTHSYFAKQVEQCIEALAAVRLTNPLK